MDLGVFFALSMFVIFMAMILIGYNVAFSFGVTGLAFSILGDLTGTFEPARLALLPSNWFSAVSNQTLLAVPFFVLMGALLEKSGLAERCLLYTSDAADE